MLQRSEIVNMQTRRETAFAILIKIEWDEKMPVGWMREIEKMEIVRKDAMCESSYKFESHSISPFHQFKQS